MNGAAPNAAPPPTVLTIAGLDPSGGAGIVADCAVLGLFRTLPAAIATCLTTQSLRRFVAVNPVAPGVLAAQMRTLLADQPPSAIKVGLVPTPELVRTIADELRRARNDAPLVLDPVMVPSLLEPGPEGEATAAALLDTGLALRTALVPLATVVTPNLHELPRLAPPPPGGTKDRLAMAQDLIAAGARSVLIKGIPRGETTEDWLQLPSGLVCLRAPTIHGPKIHGTGCMLSSAIAALLALGRPLEVAVAQGVAFLRERRTTAEPPADGDRMVRLPLTPP